MHGPTLHLSWLFLGLLSTWPCQNLSLRHLACRGGGGKKGLLGGRINQGVFKESWMVG